MTVTAEQPPCVHRFTSDELLRIVEVGALKDRHVELIEGEVIDLAPQRNGHILEPRVHRFTSDELLRMVEAGALENTRVELIEGEIIDMAPQRNDHALAVTYVLRCLMRVCSQHWVRCQMPLAVTPHIEPEPDIAVVPGPPESYAGRAANPTEALLVIEVSDTTLRYDRKRKTPVYAAAGIAEFWIINLPDQVVEVHRQPAISSATYAERRVYYKGESIAPLCAAIAIPVADLLP